MDYDDEVRRIIGDLLGRDTSDLTPETPLSVLEMDDLDNVELMMDLEDELDITIDDDEFDSIETYGGLVTFVQRLKEDK
jgi:acyl carrier protein